MIAMLRAVTVYFMENLSIKAKVLPRGHSSLVQVPYNGITDYFLTDVRNGSHPDAAMTQGGRVCCAVGVDVGLWIVNSTFHLPEQEAIRETEKTGGKKRSTST